MDEFKVFNDPVHGHIEVHPLCVKIIDTPQFQRLRHIKQLGTCYLVFPGAVHTRFEHSLGVGYLAGALGRQLQSKQPELKITDEDILCVEIAGLCHDLGHGPLSHMFDAIFIPLVNGNKDWKHEHASVKMFEYLVKSNDLEKEFEKFGLSSTDRIFITEQIAGPTQLCPEGNWPYKGRPKEKGFLYEIVANKRNGIDVDKWDYFARDCLHLGIRSNFDHLRFMKFARVLEVNGELQICSRDKEVGNCYDMFYTRNVLHRRAYQHKNTKIIECMICEALQLANEHLQFTNEAGKKLKISETIHDMSAYVKVHDGIFYLILMSTDVNLKPARDILERIQRRELYRFVGQTKPVETKSPLDSEQKMSEKITEVSKNISPRVPLNPSELIVQIVRYDYGMRQDNPVDHVRFYCKSNPSQPIHFRQQQVSDMLPQTFSEQYIQVYLKNRDPEMVALAKKCFNIFCDSNRMVPPKCGDPNLLDMTPEKSGQQEQTSASHPSDVEKVLGIRKNIQF